MKIDKNINNDVKVVILPSTPEEIRETRRNMEYAFGKIASRLAGEPMKVTIRKKGEGEEVKADRQEVV